MTNDDNKLKEALEEAAKLNVLPAKEQVKLNQPLADPKGVDDVNRKFLENIVEKIDKGEIVLYQPSSLINQAIYSGLSEELQGNADLNAVNLLARLREIKGLHDIGETDSYQMENLVEQVRLTKEQLEKDSGDIFII